MRYDLIGKKQENKKENKDCRKNPHDRGKNPGGRKDDLLDEWIDYRKKENRPL